LTSAQRPEEVLVPIGTFDVPPLSCVASGGVPVIVAAGGVLFTEFAVFALLNASVFTLLVAAAGEVLVIEAVPEILAPVLAVLLTIASFMPVAVLAAGLATFAAGAIAVVVDVMLTEAAVLPPTSPVAARQVVPKTTRRAAIAMMISRGVAILIRFIHLLKKASMGGTKTVGLKPHRSPAGDQSVLVPL
jgi:hypothetical protein